MIGGEKIAKSQYTLLKFSHIYIVKGNALALHLIKIFSKLKYTLLKFSHIYIASGNGFCLRLFTPNRKEKWSMNYINKEQLKAIIHSIPDGKFFSLFFTRVAPKCESCGRSNKKWAGLTICPKCGGALSLTRETLAQKGVANPGGCAAPTGDGVSAEEAEARWDNLKFYDRNAKNPDGTIGGYRQAKYSNVLRLRVDGVDYVVIK